MLVSWRPRALPAAPLATSTLACAISLIGACFLDVIDLSQGQCTSQGACLEGYRCDPSSWQCLPDDGQAGGTRPCVCTDPPPDGWEGPFLSFTTPPDSEPTACLGAAAPEAYFSGPPDAAATVCEKCACAPPVATCHAAQLLCKLGGSTCSGATSIAVGACTKVTSDNFSCRLQSMPGTVDRASCAPTGGTVMGTPPTWAHRHDLCTAESPECGAASACVDQGPNVLVCIRKKGTDVCPAPWSDRRDVYRGATDTRGCTSCACGNPDPADVSCGPGEYLFFGSAGCGGTPFDTVDSSICTSFSGVAYVKEVPDMMPDVSNASCLPTTTTVPTGSFVPEEPATLCCRLP
jgi:hypothetical protein